MFQDVVHKIIDKDYALISKKIEDFIISSVEKTKSRGVILGLSGGIDSAVMTILAKNALPKNTLVMILPDSKISPKEETQDAMKVVESLDVEYKLQDINLLVNQYTQILEPDKKSTGNLRARIRTNLLYYYANMKNYLVLGSSDKSEYLIGYFTKFGDGSADVLPIVSLYKTQIRKLAEYLGVPQNIINKKSSPNLWLDHDAESEIGMSYEEIDAILYCLIDSGKSIEESQEILQISKNKIEKISSMHKNSNHKRTMATKFVEI